MSRFVPADRDTAYLLPPSVDEWLPNDHLARFVVEVIEQLDLSELTRQYAGRGSAAHHPAVLLGLLIYGYANGVHSSRKIERATYDSVAFRYVAANTHPDHDTLATFRRRFLKEIESLFVQVLVLARDCLTGSTPRHVPLPPSPAWLPVLRFSPRLDAQFLRRHGAHPRGQISSVPLQL